MNESRWEHALHTTKGLGDLRRDAAILLGVAAVVFAGLRLLMPGSVTGNLLYSLLVGFGVLVVVPLVELIWNYRRAPDEPGAREDAEAPAEPGEEQREQELRERFRSTL